MYSLFIISFILLSVTSIRSQSFLEDLTLSASYAYESVDDRIVSVADEGEKVYQWSVGVNKTIWETRRWEMVMGLGYSKRNIQYNREFYRCYFGLNSFGGHCAINNGLGVPLKSYNSHIIQLPVDFNFYPFGLSNLKGFITMKILNGVAINRHVTTLRRTAQESKSIIEWEGLEVNPGVGIDIEGVRVQVNYRLLHLRPYDPVFFATKKVEGIDFTNGDPPYKGKLNTYNPFKLWLSMGYRLGRIE